MHPNEPFLHTFLLIIHPIISFRENNTAYTILAREMAPGAASEDMFVPTDKSSTEGKRLIVLRENTNDTQTSIIKLVIRVTA